MLKLPPPGTFGSPQPLDRPALATVTAEARALERRLDIEAVRYSKAHVADGIIPLSAVRLPLVSDQLARIMRLQNGN